jgi:hypothetical protein
VAAAIWDVMKELKVGVGKVLLVANSKALHHLLPDLVTPIDRNYALRFFVGRASIWRSHDADYFKALFPLYREMAGITITSEDEDEPDSRLSEHPR